jgi:hypothetical protein
MSATRRLHRSRAEISHCQRWVELRIEEWLGPAKEGFKGNQYSASLPGNEAEINDRHKYEFHFLAENKAAWPGFRKGGHTQSKFLCSHRGLGR